MVPTISHKTSFVPIVLAALLILAEQIIFSVSPVLAIEKAMGENRIEIVIKETSIVHASEVLLKDIADISANGFLKDALGKVVIAPSPNPDKIKSIDKKRILAAIRNQKYLPEDITVVSPERIYIKRQSREVTVGDIQTFIEPYLSALFPKGEFQLQKFNVRGLEAYPDGNIRFQPDSDDMVDKNGRLACYIDVMVDGKKEDRLSVTGLISLYEDVLHVKKSMSKGEMITPDDIFRKKRNVFEFREIPVKRFGEIEGKVLKSSVRKGDVIKRDLLCEPHMIVKGDIITLVAKNENLIIVTTGISKENGFENDVIRVENLNSGRLVRGIVKKKTEVEVIY